VTVAGFAILLLILYVGGIVVYLGDTGVDVAELHQGNLPPEHLSLNVTTVAIDTAKQQVTLSIVPEPTGKLTEDKGWTAKKDLSFTIYTANEFKTITIKAGDPMAMTEIAIPAFGDIAVYPFDRYAGWITFESDEPLAIAWESHLQAYHAVVALSEHSTSDSLSIDSEFSRSTSVRAFALFLFALMGLVATIAVIVTVNVAVNGYKLEFGQIGWTAALLFVLPAVRSGLPGQPPVGTLGDFLVFFWAEFLVVVCLATLVRRWIVTNRPTSEKSDETNPV
jgi:Domain of unknown function (DUF4436)